MKRTLSKASQVFLVAAVSVMAGVPTPGFAGISSSQLNPADGTTGQNLLVGSGIKTAHIQDGAITDGKISGPISTSKLAVGTEPGTVASGDHRHDDLYLKKAGNVAVVAKSGGDYSSPVAAMADLASWCGTPAPSNTCLLKIMPGTYDIGANNIQMREYVDIEGSGQKVTTITGVGGGTNFKNIIAGASNAEIRQLTLDARGPLEYGIAGIFNNGTFPKISNVTIIGSSGNLVEGVANYGVPGNAGEVVLESVAIQLTGSWPFGIENQSIPSISMKNVTIQLTPTVGSRATGVFNAHCDATIKDVTIVTAGMEGRGIQNTGSNTVTITNATIETGKLAGTIGIDAWAPTGSEVVKIDRSSIAANWAISNSTGGQVSIANSKLDGYVQAWSPGVKCFGNYNANYDPVTCP